MNFICLLLILESYYKDNVLDNEIKFWIKDMNFICLVLLLENYYKYNVLDNQIKFRVKDMKFICLVLNCRFDCGRVLRIT